LTPSDFLIEHGWGGREVRPDWQSVELKSVGSFWGHQGLFESLGEADMTPLNFDVCFTPDSGH
jgi:hypothetical protein